MPRLASDRVVRLRECPQTAHISLIKQFDVLLPLHLLLIISLTEGDDWLGRLILASKPLPQLCRDLSTGCYLFQFLVLPLYVRVAWVRPSPHAPYPSMDARPDATRPAALAGAHLV